MKRLAIVLGAIIANALWYAAIAALIYFVGGAMYDRLLSDVLLIVSAAK